MIFLYCFSHLFSLSFICLFMFFYTFDVVSGNGVITIIK